LPLLAIGIPNAPNVGIFNAGQQPVDPAAYDYDQAARDALTFARAVRPVHPEPAPLPWL
jgi:hypothetical protein